MVKEFYQITLSSLSCMSLVKEGYCPFPTVHMCFVVTSKHCSNITRTCAICKTVIVQTYSINRSWQQGGGGGGGGWCAVVETSVAHGGPPATGARGVVLASRYLAQPAGKGRSRLVHLARVDTMCVPSFLHNI